MKKSKHIGRIVETHSYTLWRDVAEREDNTFVADDIVISMGDHGEVQVTPAHDRNKNLAGLSRVDRMNDLVGHNMAEMRRAVEEGAKWEQRLKDSPLGKTQQDFVTYYTEVIEVFTEWCTAHGISIPN